ncbi:uncharacterized protein LOC124865504 isoform X2 [Girardinichthys multiradiatus]|uniref:uncharacterized protein LOC124865504 isoform X2 n=1 Tax=Girardinichthys multiradiatus TaxID=208333 RepID=UPI001FADB90D|nr:uncharacterized protein LOC124865504 isoform X2 [Girardinichthys multiradiatus]
MKTIILFGLVLGALSAAGKVFFGEVGQKVTMECGAHSFNSKLEWSHDMLIIRLLRKSHLTSKGQSPIAKRSKILNNKELEITTVMETDFGKFTCNVDGVSYKHVLIVFSVLVPSDALEVGAHATLECSVKSPDNAAKVKWHKLNSLVEYSQKVDLKSADSSHKGIWQCKVSYEQDTFTKNITINVKDPVPEPTTPPLKNKATNSKNRQNSTARPGGSTKNWFNDTVFLGLIWWIWVAIGAGGLVVIILIVVVIVVYKRNKRRKRTFLRMKKVQLSRNPKMYCQCVRQTAAAKPQQGRRREKPSALPLQPLLQE